MESSDDPDAAIIIPRSNIHHRIPQRMARWWPSLGDLCIASSVKVLLARHQAYNTIFGEAKPCRVVPTIISFEEFFAQLSPERRRKVSAAFHLLFGIYPHQIGSNGNRTMVITLLQDEFLPERKHWSTALRRLRRLRIHGYSAWWAPC